MIFIDPFEKHMEQKLIFAKTLSIKWMQTQLDGKGFSRNLFCVHRYLSNGHID